MLKTLQMDIFYNFNFASFYGNIENCFMKHIFIKNLAFFSYINKIWLNKFNQYE